jgi:hypothetical protein
MRPRVLIAPLALFALVSLAGCGSGNGGSSSSSTATISSANAPAPQVAREFLAAAKSGHGSRACSLMTAETVSDVARYVESTGHGEGHPARDCAKFFSAYQTSIGGALPNLAIGRVTVNGSAARAAVVCSPACTKGFLPLHLRKTAPGWRVAYNYRRGY